MFKLAPFTKEDFFFGKVPKDLVTDFHSGSGTTIYKEARFFFLGREKIVGHL
jgi:hypothetical protein